MKLALKRWGVIILAPLFLGISSGGLVELEGYFNARYSANFLKSTRNVRFVLPPGTKAKIQEVKKFSSGKYGLNVEVLDGKQKGEKAWVYYNPSNPGMKLYEGEQAEAQDKTTKEVEKADRVRTTRKTEALRVPAGAQEKENKDAAAEVARQIEKGNKVVKEQAQPGGPCRDCEVSKLYSRDVKQSEAVDPKVSQFAGRSSADAPTLRPPTRTVNPYGVRPVTCRTVGTYDSCTSQGDPAESKFKLFNRGPNRIVPSKAENRDRIWTFEYEGGARQDLGFYISDSPNSTLSHIQETYMMVFPRKTLPHIRVEGNRQIVTLPTGETVTFNAQTREVIGGVMSEDGPITKGGTKLDPPKVTYRGSGVVVRVDARGDEPRLQKNGTATISKQGRTCKVPTKDLWPDQRQSSAAHFKYFSDSDFDTYLKSKCGFGL
nr:hypothetical protein CKG001_21270 [Bdellovibrio sp. CKG001]